MVVHKGAFHRIDSIGHPALDGIIVRYDSTPWTQLTIENRPKLGVEFRQHVKRHHGRRRYVDRKGVLGAKFDEMFDLFATRNLPSPERQVPGRFRCRPLLRHTFLPL